MMSDVCNNAVGTFWYPQHMNPHHINYIGCDNNLSSDNLTKLERLVSNEAMSVGDFKVGKTYEHGV